MWDKNNYAFRTKSMTCIDTVGGRLGPKQRMWQGPFHTCRR